MKRVTLRTVGILGLSVWSIASGCSGGSGATQADGDGIIIANGGDGNDGNSGANDNIGDDQNSGDSGVPDIDVGAIDDGADDNDAGTDGTGGTDGAGNASGTGAAGGGAGSLASGGAASHAQGDGGAPGRLVDFETLPDGSTLPVSTIITDQFASLGVTFSSDQGGGMIISNGEASSPPNLLIGNPGSFTPIVADFTEPVSVVYVTLISVGDAIVAATAFDAAMNPVDRAAVTNPGTDNGLGNHDPIALRGAGILRVRFEITTGHPGDGFGIDDFAF